MMLNMKYCNVYNVPVTIIYYFMYTVHFQQKRWTVLIINVSILFVNRKYWNLDFQLTLRLYYDSAVINYTRCMR